MPESKFRVLFVDEPGRYDFNAERRSLEPAGAEIIVMPSKTEDEIIQALRDADAVLAWITPITRRVIEAMTRCKAIVRYGVGVDNVDVEAATERGIVVVNVPDIYSPEVADHTMALLLAIARRLVQWDKLVRAGQWERKGPIIRFLDRLEGKILGLIAFGRIPREIARRAKAFGFQILAFDPYVDQGTAEGHGVTMVALEDLLSRSDYVSVHLPLQASTQHLMGEAQFRQMKPSAYFINTSRGGVVDEAALIKALQEGWIAGAALDVLADEPPQPDNPLLQMENVILTPHVAYASRTGWQLTLVRAGEEAARVLQGERPLYCVNPKAAEAQGLRPM
ncbi:MAG: C-terminal binding protein [Chloroflexi bacterium]|nr:C-terminal binding protein [Chloroflexota bacterium]